MKKFLIRTICVILVISLCLPLFSCDDDDNDNGESVKLSFKSAASYDYLKSIDGKTVEINGYMASSSPVDGSSIFLMNLPYQSCPFCVPNTTELSNTLKVYPKKRDKFNFTNQAIKVVGTLEVAPSKEDSFVDNYGYQFNFKIVDATYKILKDEDLGSQTLTWQKIAETDVVNDIYKMYDYVNFLCAWNTYFVNSYMDEKGVEQKGYYLYADDAIQYIERDGAQWNYGFKDGYFDGIISRIRRIDANAFEDLIANIEGAKALAERAYNELKSGNYTSVYKYVEKFGQNDYVYTLNNGEELSAEMDRLYSAFSDWLGSYEL